MTTSPAPRKSVRLGAAAWLALFPVSACELPPIELGGADGAPTPVIPDAEADVPVGEAEPLFPSSRRYQVELTWRRADGGGPSPTHEGGGEIGLGAPSGADLDLHFAHPFAVGRDIDGDGTADGWFDVPFDVHWNNPMPAWGAEGSDDDGRLDRDDRAGPGPEVVTLDACHDQRFAIGVHAFGDGLGTATLARVDVFLDGLRTFTASRSLLAGDLWEVGHLGCDGQVSPAGRVVAGVTVGPPR